MSTIRKTPYIETVLSSLNATQLTALKTAINSTANGSDANYSLPDGVVPSENVIECASILLARDKHRNGILIKTASYCVFLVYGESQKITIYNVNFTNKTFSLVEEYCDIEELRRCLDDSAEHGGDEWVETMKDKMVYNSETSEIEVGTHLYVDGKLEIGDTGGSAGDLVVGHEIVIDDLQKIVDTNGDSFIPDPSGHLNECLVHYTSGYTWKKVTELSGIELVTKATFEGGEFVTHTGIIYVVYDTDGTCYVRYYTA